MSENPESESTRTLATVARDLSVRVDQLGRQLTVSRAQMLRMRYLTAAFGLLAVAAVLGAIYSFQLSREVEATVAQNRETQVQSCQNANQAREANRILWGFVLDLSTASNPDRSPDRQAAMEELRTWINALYAPRDCSDLSRDYSFPDPPPIIGQF